MTTDKAVRIFMMPLFEINKKVLLQMIYITTTTATVATTNDNNNNNTEASIYSASSAWLVLDDKHITLIISFILIENHFNEMKTSKCKFKCCWQLLSLLKQ